MDAGNPKTTTPSALVRGNTHTQTHTWLYGTLRGTEELLLFPLVVDKCVVPSLRANIRFMASSKAISDLTSLKLQ